MAVGLFCVFGGRICEAQGTPGDRIRYVDPSFSDVYAPIEVNNWWGLMNRQGRLVIYPQFEWTDNAYDGWVRVVKDGKTGYVRSALRGDRDPEKSQLIITPQYEYGDRFQEKFAVVGNGGRYGFINLAGRLRTEMVFDGVLRFKDGLAAVRIDDRCGFINIRGKIVVDLRWVRVRSFHDGFAMVESPGVNQEPGILGYINRAGRFYWRDQRGRFEDLGDFHEGLALARINSKWGYIGKSGRIQIEPKFDEARDFHNGLAAVRVGPRWGFINKSGRLAIDLDFDVADDFDESLAMVVVEGRYGYVNKVGKWRVPLQFERALPYFRGMARVAAGPGFGYIDTTGNVVWDPRRAMSGFVDITTRPRVLVSGGVTQRQAVGRTKPVSEVIGPPEPRELIEVPYPPDFEYVEQLSKLPAPEVGPLNGDQ